MGKCIKIYRIGRAWKISTHFFHQSMGIFFPSDFHLMVKFTTWEMHGFSHQFLIAQENAAKSTLWALRLFFHSNVFLLVPKSSDPLKKQTEKTDKVNHVFQKRKINSRNAGIPSKIYQKRRGNGSTFIKKEKYKYILDKSMPPYTILSLFLVISSKNTSPTQKFQ